MSITNGQEGIRHKLVTGLITIYMSDTMAYRLDQQELLFTNCTSTSTFSALTGQDSK